MENATYTIDLHRNPAVIHVFCKGLKYQVCLKDGSTIVEMNGHWFPINGCPFPMELSLGRFWGFVLKNTHGLIRSVLVIVALVLLQFGLMITLPGEFAALSIGYFSLFMNAAICLGFCMVFVAVCGKYFIGNFEICLIPEKEKEKLLDAGDISVSPDILVCSLTEDESSESFKFRMDEAFKAAQDHQWVAVIAFRNHLVAINEGETTDGISASSFLRTKPFVPGPFSEIEVVECINAFKLETFDQYLSWCREFAKEFVGWSSKEKMGRVNIFDTIASSMKSVLVFAMLVFPSILPAQKTAQVAQYLGDRATIGVPESGKEVSFVFEKREISVIAQGKNYIETLKSVPYFQDDQNAGRLLLIKVGSEMILPKSPNRQSVEKAEIPTDVPVVGGGASENFYSSLPDSLEADALINKDKVDRLKNWVQIKPSIGLWMYRFHRLLGALFILGCFLWVVAAIGASEAVNDLGAVKVISDFLISVYVISKSVLIGIWVFVLAVYTLEAMITQWFTGELSAYFFSKFCFVSVFAAILFKWVFPDLQKRRAGSGGNIVSNVNYNHRALNG